MSLHDNSNMKLTSYGGDRGLSEAYLRKVLRCDFVLNAKMVPNIQTGFVTLFSIMLKQLMYENKEREKRVFEAKLLALTLNQRMCKRTTNEIRRFCSCGFRKIVAFLDEIA